MTPRPWPTEIRLSPDKRQLALTFEGGLHFDFSAEFLRVESPSAEVQGHGQQEKKILGGKRHVAIDRIEPIGNYAVRLHFSDGHATGIYSWDKLLELGENQEGLWQTYLRALDVKGLSRDSK